MSPPSPGAGLVALAIHRPVSVLVGILLIALAGLLSLRELPIQLTPDITVPTLSVTTSWPGAAPAEIERDLLVEQEEVLKGLDGLQRLTSEASQGQGTITLEFAVGARIEDLLVRASNRLGQLPTRPEGSRPPVLATSSEAGPPLAVILVMALDGSDVAPFRTWVGDEVVSRLERVSGVARIDHFGGRDTEVEILFDPAALAARRVPLGELAARVRGELRDVSGGDMVLGKRQYLVRTQVAPSPVEELGELVLRTDEDGRVVRLSDVATVQEGLRKYSARVMGDGQEAMVLLLRKEAGRNVLEVTREVREAVAELNERRMNPRGLTLRIVSDQVDYIEGALGLVRQNLLLGAGLAALVLLLFLRSLRASAVVALAIPICVLGTIAGMNAMGRTVNVVSLAGMAFAVGMVVDNAIVVLENIETHRRRRLAAGEDPLQAARGAAQEGTAQVWGALVASTLTTAAVFLPIIAWQDEVGELLRDVAVAISLAVGLSLLVSVLVIPSFAARLLASGSTVASDGRLVAIGAALRERVGRAAGLLVRRPGLGLAVVLFAVLGSVAVGARLLPAAEYLPTGNRNLLFGVVLPPSGYSVAEMTAMGEQVQSAIVPHIGADPARSDADGWPAVGRTFFIARPGQGFMGVTAARDEDIGRLIPKVQGVLRQVPGVIGIVNQASLFGRGVGSSRAVDLEIRGAEVETLAALGGRLMGRLREVMPTAQVRPLPSLDIGAPELRAQPRRREAAAQGLSAADIGLAVDALVDGRIIGELGGEGQPRVDVVLRARGDGPASPAELAGAAIATPRGQVVPLGSVARLEETVAPSTIRRLERRRAITLQITPPTELPLQAAIEQVQSEIIAPLQAELPSGVELGISGTAGDLQRARENMARVLALAVVVSFLLMAALFEDLLAPLVILVTVPLAGAGGVLGLVLVDALLGPQPLDMMTALGFVILIGVVVNNAILVVDLSLEGLRAGLDLPTASRQAVEGRLRAIAMSSTTSLVGLLPLVLFPGNGAELYRGVGAIVLGGLGLSTLLTVFVVPALFGLVWRLRAAGRPS